MKRRQLLGGTGAVVAAAVAGCLGGAGVGGAGGGSDTGSERTITVSKSGEVTGEPDMAVVRAAIEASGDSQTAVRDELSRRAERLTDALEAAGVDAESITTDRFSIRQRTDRRPVEPTDDTDASEPAYVGSHAFRIEVDDADAAGDIVDTAIEAGADNIGRIAYTLSEERQAELREEALQSALAATRTEAEFVAGEVDASVGDVVTVDTDRDRISPVYETAEDDAAGRSTDLQPDDVTVRATATVSYRLD
ncbi:SIMPL domain-containing protein [Halohasta salina]|uniref:SIMPL domain-containing protein n=1 Tax=Halohasta salina TaxID=2961621 RepID=UPI0020A5443E|nr:SIMPL domain-containing protein [Halohasta salina]